MTNRWATLGAIAAGITAMLAALNGFNHQAPWFLVAQEVFVRIFSDWKVIVAGPSVLFGGLCGVAYPWYLAKDSASEEAKSRVRIASGLLTLLMALLITMLLGRGINGVILSVICATGGPMLSMAALSTLMAKAKIVPAAFVPNRKEVGEILEQVRQAENPQATPVVLPVPTDSEPGEGGHG